MAKLTRDEFISALKEMTLLEINDLVEAMKDEFGIDPSSVAVAAAPVAGATQDDGPSTVTVTLVNPSTDITITNNDSISLNKIEMTDINFVIGKDEKEIKPQEELDTLEVDPSIIIDEIDLPTSYIKRKEETQLGYVSYCLLGIMSVIISLVLLYVLL